MGLRRKAHDLVINSKTMSRIDKTTHRMMKVKTRTPLPRQSFTLNSNCYLSMQNRKHLLDKHIIMVMVTQPV